MKRNSLIGSLVSILVVVAALAALLVAGQRPQLGLDLQGGISAVYTPRFEAGAEIPEDLEAVLDETISIIRQRVDSLGVAEPDISRAGTDVLVQLPGLEDAERAREVIGTTAQLSFRPVTEVLFPGLPGYDDTPPCIALETDTNGNERYVLSEDRPKPAPEVDGVVCGPFSPTDTPSDEATEEGTSAPAPGTEVTVVAAQESDPTPADSPSDEPTDEPTDEATDEPTDGPTDGATDEPTEEATDEPTEPVEVTFADGLPDDAPRPLKYVVGASPATSDGGRLTGDNIDDARPGLDGGGRWVVNLDLDGPGGDAFAAITAELACARDAGEPGLLAIVLDDIVESAPQMNTSILCGQGITGGSATISVGGTDLDEQQAEAQDLALVLRTGALPITLEPATFETVSPTLGATSLRNGLIAGVIGLVLVAIYLIYFYRALGLVAIGALSIFGVLIVGTITLLGKVGFALTLAGIAGIIVSIGITADSSIIFFERIRDEVALGKTMRTAAKKGFDSAFRTNLAGNTVTLSAAIILYFLAVGPVRGFALTLGLATILDILILWAYSRSVVGLLAGAKKLSRRAVGVRAEA